jgi:hypothetical protein
MLLIIVTYSESWLTLYHIIIVLHYICILTGNHIGPEGTTVLAPALEKLTNLQKLL